MLDPLQVVGVFCVASVCFTLTSFIVFMNECLKFRRF